MLNVNKLTNFIIFRFQKIYYTGCPQNNWGFFKANTDTK